jgi:hypothetical protein
MSNQRFLKIVCFRFPTNVPKKIEYICFLNKIHYQTKAFSFKSPNFWSKSNLLIQFSNFFETSKSSVLFLEICELNQNVWFCSKIFGLNSNVLLLLKKRLEHIKKFWFCSEIFGINGNVLLLQKNN